MIVMATELQWIISTLVHLVGTGFDGNPGCEKKGGHGATQFSHSADTSKFSDMAQSNRQKPGPCLQV